MERPSVKQFLEQRKPKEVSEGDVQMLRDAKAIVQAAYEKQSGLLSRLRAKWERSQPLAETYKAQLDQIETIGREVAKTGKMTVEQHGTMEQIREAHKHAFEQRNNVTELNADRRNQKTELQELRPEELDKRCAEYITQARDIENQALETSKWFTWPGKKQDMRNQLDNLYAQIQDMRAIINQKRQLEKEEQLKSEAITPPEQSVTAARSVLDTIKPLSDTGDAQAINKLAFFSPDTVLRPLRTELVAAQTQKESRLKEILPILERESNIQQGIQNEALSANKEPYTFFHLKIDSTKWEDRDPRVFERELSRIEYQYQSDVRQLDKENGALLLALQQKRFDYIRLKLDTDQPKSYLLEKSSDDDEQQLLAALVDPRRSKDVNVLKQFSTEALQKMIQQNEHTRTEYEKEILAVYNVKERYQQLQAEAQAKRLDSKQMNQLSQESGQLIVDLQVLRRKITTVEDAYRFGTANNEQEQMVGAVLSVVRAMDGIEEKVKEIGLAPEQERVHAEAIAGLTNVFEMDISGFASDEEGDTEDLPTENIEQITSAA